MSLKERDRLAVFRQVRERQMTVVEASRRLGVSYRQAKRLWRSYRESGDVGLVHGLRGCRSNNAASADDRRDRAVELYRRCYGGFGPTLAAEALARIPPSRLVHAGWPTSRCSMCVGCAQLTMK